MGLFSAAKLFGMTIRESATDGSDFTNPDADYRRLFLGEDGLLHLKDSAGTVTDVGGGSGSVATDAIWDAAGDLAVGTGANTAAKITKGAAGTVPTAGASTLAYAYPPGYEFNYVETTTEVTLTGTSEGTANTVVASGSVAYDGSTIIIVEYFCPRSYSQDSSGNVFLLYEDSTVLGRLGLTIAATAASFDVPVLTRRRVTPSSGSHTYTMKAYSTAADGVLYHGSGGSSAQLPGYIRITKV